MDIEVVIHRTDCEDTHLEIGFLKANTAVDIIKKKLSLIKSRVNYTHWPITLEEYKRPKEAWRKDEIL